MVAAKVRKGAGGRVAERRSVRELRFDSNRIIDRTRRHDCEQLTRPAVLVSGMRDRRRDQRPCLAADGARVEDFNGDCFGGERIATSDQIDVDK